MKSKIVYIVCSLLYALLLPFHMLNSMEVAGGIKLWYLPVACLAIAGLFCLGELRKSLSLRLYGAFVLLAFTYELCEFTSYISGDASLSQL